MRDGVLSKESKNTRHLSSQEGAPGQGLRYGFARGLAASHLVDVAIHSLIIEDGPADSSLISVKKRLTLEVNPKS